MNMRITVKSYLNQVKLEARYRQAKDPVEKSHWQIMWLVGQGKGSLCEEAQLLLQRRNLPYQKRTRFTG
jgi:hypothetical protein